MPQSQTIKSLPRLRLPSSLTRLVLPRATHRLTQLGAPYSECEGSLTVSEDHGQTRVLLSLPVNQSSHVSGRHYLKHCADCVFALPERPRHALGSSSSIAIDHLRRGSIDELRATPSGPVTAKWVPLQTSQKYGNQNSHSQTSTQQALTRSRHQILFVPALVAAFLYFFLAYALLPLIRKHRARYNQYLPLDTISSTSTTLRDRFSDFITRLARPPGQVVDGREDTDGDVFGDEEGESMVGFDYRSQEREVRGGRVESLWSDGRLSRDLEEGFKDDSEEEEGEDDRRGMRL